MRTHTYNIRRTPILGALFVCSIILLLGCQGIQVSHYYNNGAVATSAPMATEIGVQVFREGGNAFDVAVAVGFVLAVVHPEAGNIGGGGFALIREGSSGTIKALDFREKAPLAATENMYLDKEGNVIEGLSTRGAKACGVPGTVAGLYELWRTRGALPWDKLVGIAASLADTGFIIDEYLANSFTEHEQALTFYPETKAVFAPNGSLLQAGERWVQKDLARTLYAIAAEGPKGFYQGEVAQKIIASMEKHDGLITQADLDAYETVWRKPVHVVFDSLDIYSMPLPSSGGIVMGQILKILEPFDLSPYVATAPEYIQLFCEASRLAFADRAQYLGDPAFFDVPSGLLDSNYLAHRRSLITPGKASTSEAIGPGIPYGESDQTTHFSVCDKSGNMVAVTYTLNTAYGSKLVVDSAGFLLNNEMDDFSIKPGVPNTYGLVGGEANKIEPGKRMLSSMSPTLVLKNDKPYLVLGAPGGSKIITVVAQTIVDIARFDMTLPEAVKTPRFHHQWLPDVIYLEEHAFDINTKQTLIRYGYNIKERSAYSDLEGIFIDKTGMMNPVSDPRKRGKAGGY